MRNSISLDMSRPSYASSSCSKNTTLYAEMCHPSILFLPVHINSKLYLMMNSVATLNSLFFRELKVQLTVCCEGGILSGEVVSVVCLPFFFFVPLGLRKGLACSPPLALAHYVGFQQGVWCDDHHDCIAAGSQFQQWVFTVSLISIQSL